MSADARLREALKPFADFADPRNVVPFDHVITQGSSMAKRQLTMGDCYEARAALTSTAKPSEDALQAAREMREDMKGEYDG